MGWSPDLSDHPRLFESGLSTFIGRQTLVQNVFLSASCIKTYKQINKTNKQILYTGNKTYWKIRWYRTPAVRDWSVLIRRNVKKRDSRRTNCITFGHSSVIQSAQTYGSTKPSRKFSKQTSSVEIRINKPKYIWYSHRSGYIYIYKDITILELPVILHQNE